MKTVEELLSPISEYLFSITRDTVNGWYVLEIGVLPNWVYKENDYIGCEIIDENEDGKLVKIYPKIEKIVLDDLINFVTIIIGTNRRIAEKEAEFKEKMEQIKKELEKDASKFYEELDILKKSSFEKKAEEKLE